jgi:hypothetical protein
MIIGSNSNPYKKLLEDEQEVNYSHENEGYVIIDEEKYYITNKYVRDDVVNSVIERAEGQHLMNFNWIIDEVLPDYYSYENSDLEYSISDVLDELRHNDEFKSFFYRLDNEELYEEDIEEIMKESERSIFDYNPDNKKFYLIKEEESHIEGDYFLELDRIFYNINDINTIYIKNKNTNDYYLENKWITDKEKDIIIQKIASITNNYDYSIKSKLEDYIEYPNNTSNNNLYYDMKYTIYDVIDLDIFKEKLNERGLLFYKSEDNSTWEDDEEE